jgi:branched-subunit amino acid aminotransferase/4-amino-4-deoxychorismate lyase
MMTVDQQFTILNEKLQRLLQNYNRLQREAEKLKEELAESRAREIDAKNKMEELQGQVSILKLAAGEMTDKDKKKFERKLNQYIKEIDRTIAYLSE